MIVGCRPIRSSHLRAFQLASVVVEALLVSLNRWPANKNTVTPDGTVGFLLHVFST